jgi:hypothetical protein
VGRRKDTPRQTVFENAPATAIIPQKSCGVKWVGSHFAVQVIPTTAVALAHCPTIAPTTPFRRAFSVAQYNHAACAGVAPRPCAKQPAKFPLVHTSILQKETHPHNSTLLTLFESCGILTTTRRWGRLYCPTCHTRMIPGKYQKTRVYLCTRCGLTEQIDQKTGNRILVWHPQLKRRLSV